MGLIFLVKKWTGKFGEEERSTESEGEEEKKKEIEKERKRKEEVNCFFVVFFSHLEGDIKFLSSIFNDQSIFITLTLTYFINGYIFLFFLPSL